MPVRAILAVLGVALLLLCRAGTVVAEMPAMAGAGVIETNGKRTCSGALIAPDLVATAAHCLGGRVLETRGGDARMVFHTGAYPGHRSVARAVVEIRRHPFYRPGAAGIAERVSADIAVLRLGAAVPGGTARPLARGAPIAAADRVVIASWPGGQGARARERLCPVVTVGPLVVTLGCEVRMGESGAPVVRLTAEGPVLAGLVVAAGKAGRRPLAFVVQADARLRQLGALFHR